MNREGDTVHSIRAVAVEIFTVVFKQEVSEAPEGNRGFHKGRGQGFQKGRAKSRWVSCRVKRASPLRKLVGPRFQWEMKNIHEWGLPETVKGKQVRDGDHSELKGSSVGEGLDNKENAMVCSGLCGTGF